MFRDCNRIDDSIPSLAKLVRPPEPKKAKVGHDNRWLD